MPPSWYVDECLNKDPIYNLLTEHNFIWESHVARYGPGLEDTTWVPTICGEEKIILTADLSRDSRPKKMLPLLRAHNGRAVLLLPKLLSNYARLVERLRDDRARMEAAMGREPLVIRLSTNACEAVRHDERAIRYTVRGNGSLREIPPQGNRRTRAEDG